MLRVFVGAECVSANQPFEVYLVALRDGGTLEALEVGVEGLESSGLVLLEEELLARDLTVRTEDDAGSTPPSSPRAGDPTSIHSCVSSCSRPR